MFVQMVSSKPQSTLFPNFEFLCIIMSQSVMQKDWFAIFKVKVTWLVVDYYQFPRTQKLVDR